MATVIAPRHAGVLSALGMLLADVKKDYSISVLRRADSLRIDELERLFTPLVVRGLQDLGAEGFAGDRALIERLLDVRYVGQSYEITVPFDAEYRAAFGEEPPEFEGVALMSDTDQLGGAAKAWYADVTLAPRAP